MGVGHFVPPSSPEGTLKTLGGIGLRIFLTQLRYVVSPTNDNDIVNLGNDLNSVKKINKKELNKVREYINHIEDAQKLEINKLAQCNRSSFMLEISSIPGQDGENVIDLGQKLQRLLKYIILMNQTNIALRVSEKGMPPIK